MYKRQFYDRHGINYRRLEVLDATVPADPYLSEGADWIDEQIEDGRTVLVHCAKGRGRSATLVAAYMMRHEDLPYDECRATLPGGGGGDPRVSPAAGPLSSGRGLSLIHI